VSTRFRVALSTWTYPRSIGIPGRPPPPAPLDAHALLERAGTLGVHVVQYADNLPLHALEGAELDALLVRARELGVDLEVGTRGIDPDHLATQAELAVRVGSPFVRVVIDRGEDRPDPAEAVRRLALSEVVFREAGLLLAVENHDRYTTTELAELVRSLGDWTGICLDTVNSYAALEAPTTVVSALAPHAINLHVKDFAIERAPDGLGFHLRGRAVGEGLLAVREVLAAVEPSASIRLGAHPPSAVIELWTPPGGSPEEETAREERWAARSVAALRALGLR